VTPYPGSRVIELLKSAQVVRGTTQTHQQHTGQPQSQAQQRAGLGYRRDRDVEVAVGIAVVAGITVLRSNEQIMRADGDHNIHRRIAAGHCVDDEILRDIRAQSIVIIWRGNKVQPCIYGSGYAMKVGLRQQVLLELNIP